MMDTDRDTIIESHDLDNLTNIAENNGVSEKKSVVSEFEQSSQTEEETRKNNKGLKTAAGIAAGGASIVGATGAFMQMNEDAQIENVAEDNTINTGLDNISIVAEEVELPELIVEALAPKHEDIEDTNSSGYKIENESESASETIYAEVLESKPDKADQYLYTQTSTEDSVIAQTDSPSEENPYVDDIQVVSVGSGIDSESDIQILGVTQDISTGYNVGHLSVDGEEVVVIDVDGDMIFDSMVADLNHDGDITSDEIIDISQHSLALGDFSGRPDIFSDPMSGDAPDYLSDLGN